MANRRPNILFLMSDEHRADTAGFAGNAVVRTPTLDRLASEGAVFTNCYTAAPVCVPARQCMLSGQYPWTCGCEGWTALRPGHMTFPRRLAEYAYETVACGNMHLMGPDQMAGFTKRVGENCEIAGRYRWARKEEAAKYARPFESYKWSMAKEIQRAAPGVGPNRRRDDYALLGALDCIEEHFLSPFYDREKPQTPLFLAVSLVQPHYPFFADPELFKYYLNRVEPFSDCEPIGRIRREMRVRPGKDASDREIRRALACYYAMIETIDGMYARVLDALEKAGQDLDDWIVVYCSDHGDMLGEHGLWEKGVFYEGSVKVPLVIRWPRGFKGGRRIEENVSLVDLFATLCDLCGVPIPEGLDSRSLAPLLRGERGAAAGLRPDHVLSQ